MNKKVVISLIVILLLIIIGITIALKPKSAPAKPEMLLDNPILGAPEISYIAGVNAAGICYYRQVVLNGFEPWIQLPQTETKLISCQMIDTRIFALDEKGSLALYNILKPEIGWTIIVIKEKSSNSVISPKLFTLYNKYIIVKNESNDIFYCKIDLDTFSDCIKIGNYNFTDMCLVGTELWAIIDGQIKYWNLSTNSMKDVTCPFKVNKLSCDGVDLAIVTDITLPGGFSPALAFENIRGEGMSNWSIIPGGLVNIFIRLTNIYGINDTDNVYYTKTMDGKTIMDWTQIDGLLKQITSN